MSEFIGNLRGKVSEFIADRRAKAAAYEHARKSAIIDRKFSAINEQRDWLAEKLFREISRNYEGRVENFAETCNYFNGFNEKKILGTVDQLKYMRQRDIDLIGKGRSYRFNVCSGMILEGIDSGALHRVIQSAIDEHSVRVSSNAMLTGIAVARGNYGLAALAASGGVADKAKAGYHNGAIKRLFQDSIFRVYFFKSAADMNDVEFKYARLAQRIYELRVVDRKVSGPLLFSMVFKGGDCRVAPIEGDKYDRAAPAEFISRFGGYVMSQRDAAQRIDELVASNHHVKMISNMTNVSYCVTDLEGNWTFV